MSTQIAGATVANIAEVEAATKALRIVLRPDDWGSLGIYSCGGASGVMAAGLAAGSIVFAARYTGSGLALVKRIRISAADTATAFAAGVCTFTGQICRSFSAFDTGGTSLTPTANANKLRTTMATSGMSGLSISSTAALGTGTRTPDALQFAALTGSIPAVAGSSLILPGTPLFEQKPGDYPLVLANNEGLEILATVPATGTWTFSVDMTWLELAAYF
jgi:hypothetical protein